MMNAHRCTVDHTHIIAFFGISICNSIHNIIPNARLRPAPKAVVASGMGAISLWKIGPGCARAQHPEYPVQYPPIINPWNTSALMRQDRLDHRPLKFTHLISRHSNLLSKRLNHIWLQIGIPFMSLRPSCFNRTLIPQYQ